MLILENRSFFLKCLEQGLDINCFYMTHKWMAGFLTNYKHFRSLFAAYELRAFLNQLDAAFLKKFGYLPDYMKGVKHMLILPDVVFLPSILSYRLAYREVVSLKLPVVSFIGGYENYYGCLYEIPGSSSAGSVLLFLNFILKLKNYVLIGESKFFFPSKSFLFKPINFFKLKKFVKNSFMLIRKFIIRERFCLIMELVSFWKKFLVKLLTNNLFYFFFNHITDLINKVKRYFFSAFILDSSSLFHLLNKLNQCVLFLKSKSLPFLIYKIVSVNKDCYFFPKSFHCFRFFLHLQHLNKSVKLLFKKSIQKIIHTYVSGIFFYLPLNYNSLFFSGMFYDKFRLLKYFFFKKKIYAKRSSDNKKEKKHFKREDHKHKDKGTFQNFVSFELIFNKYVPLYSYLRKLEDSKFVDLNDVGLKHKYRNFVTYPKRDFLISFRREYFFSKFEKIIRLLSFYRFFILSKFNNNFQQNLLFKDKNEIIEPNILLKEKLFYFFGNQIYFKMNSDCLNFFYKNYFLNRVKEDRSFFSQKENSRKKILRFFYNLKNMDDKIFMSFITLWKGILAGVSKFYQNVRFLRLKKNLLRKYFKKIASRQFGNAYFLKRYKFQHLQLKWIFRRWKKFRLIKRLRLYKRQILFKAKNFVRFNLIRRRHQFVSNIVKIMSSIDKGFVSGLYRRFGFYKNGEYIKKGFASFKNKLAKTLKMLEADKDLSKNLSKNRKQGKKKKPYVVVYDPKTFRRLQKQKMNFIKKLQFQVRIKNNILKRRRFLIKLLFYPYFVTLTVTSELDYLYSLRILKLHDKKN